LERWQTRRRALSASANFNSSAGAKIGCRGGQGRRGPWHLRIPAHAPRHSWRRPALSHDLAKCDVFNSEHGLDRSILARFQPCRALLRKVEAAKARRRRSQAPGIEHGQASAGAWPDQPEPKKRTCRPSHRVVPKPSPLLNQLWFGLVRGTRPHLPRPATSSQRQSRSTVVKASWSGTR